MCICICHVALNYIVLYMNVMLFIICYGCIVCWCMCVQCLVVVTSCETIYGVECGLCSQMGLLHTNAYLVML